MTTTRLASFLCCLAALGCSSSYGDGTGGDEPFTVLNATFTKGSLPISDGPEVAVAMTQTSDAFAGGPEKSLAGLATSNTYAIGVSLKDVGGGYFVVPVGLPELTEVGKLSYALKFRFNREAPLGDQTLLVAASDKNGHFGKPTEVKFKVKSLTPEGKKVISLIWNNRADLDLQVQGPGGKLTSARRPNTGMVPSNKKIPAEGIAGSGTLSRDANARCVFDGFMQEDVVFEGDPEPGEYGVWVDMFDNCGEQATTFQLVLREDGVETFSRAGQMLDINADNGTGAGLFMNTFNF